MDELPVHVTTLAAALLWALIPKLLAALRRRSSAPPAPGRTPAGGPPSGAGAKTAEAQPTSARPAEPALDEATLRGLIDGARSAAAALGPRGAPLAATLAQPGEGGLPIAAPPVAAAGARALCLHLAARSAPEVDEAMRWSEALYDDMWGPVGAAAEAGGWPQPASPALGLPAIPTEVAALRAWIPPQAPALLLPAPIGLDPLHGVHVARALAQRWLWASPALGLELGAASGWGAARPSLPSGDSIALQALFSLAAGWRGGLWADLVAATLLGPAGLEGLMAALATPSSPRDALRAAPGVAPAHLRVLATAEALEAAGFSVEAAEARARWCVMHGFAAPEANPDEADPEALPTALLLPTQSGGWVALPAGLILELLGPGVVAMRDAHLQCLGGLRLADIPGFALTPALQARARRLADQLLGPAPPPAPARLLLCAAVLALARTGTSPQAVTAAMRQHILAPVAVRSPPRQRPLPTGTPRPTRPAAPGLGVADAMRLRLSLGRVGDGLAPRALTGPPRGRSGAARAGPQLPT
ncbi:MAG: hypothetical protein JNM72_19480 [Deltaproteobacteria bacterium]|nr:hypothetical protein [Deltaproteobacteria bacterium]